MKNQNRSVRKLVLVEENLNATDLRAKIVLHTGIWVRVRDNIAVYTRL